MTARHITATLMEAWRAILGPDRARDDSPTLDHYARSTQPEGARPECILYPETLEEIQAVVRAAAGSGITLYPISRGKNWGYGDACAPTPSAAIVDLSRMNRIVELNRELAYVVIEAGVSQGQLHAYLEQHAPELWMDSTGAGLDSSVVGNTLDRGFGHTPYGDRVAHTCGMEIVLADGRVLDTGFGHYANAKAARVFPYGAGPDLEGLFSQANYGIVTKIGLWLMPKPEVFNFFFIRTDREDGVVELVERLRPLRMNGALTSAVHIGNDLRLLSAEGQYPWEETNGQTPLPQHLREKMRRRLTAGRWTASGAIMGQRGHVRAAKHAVRHAVAGVGDVHFVDDTLITWAERAARLFAPFPLGRRLKRQLGTLKPNYGLLKGIPTDEPLRGAQWRVRGSQGEIADPLDIGCGLLWISPVLPMTGAATREVLAIAAPFFEQYGFDLLATFTLINERAIIAILNLAFDKADKEETDKAARCYHAVMDALIATGYYPYRTGPYGMSKLRQEGDTFWDVATQIKRALDPEDLIARGRYIAPLKDEQQGQE